MAGARELEEITCRGASLEGRCGGADRAGSVGAWGCLGVPGGAWEYMGVAQELHALQLR